jgi:2-deoxy-D-gluconate 3-dehydrogenase
MSILERFRIDREVALVTGATGGLGTAIAIALAEAGANVACHGYSREADETCERIRDLGRMAYSFSADLSDVSQAERLYREVQARMGAPGILVNNAGILHRQAARHFDTALWSHMLDVNLTSAFRLSQLAGNAMLERGRGKIINIASLLAFQGGSEVPAYAASKAALTQLTRTLANEWGAGNLQVNAIAPGFFRTAHTEELRKDETLSRQIVDRIPAARWGEPEDLAGAVVFLASRASDYVNGELLVVDGGWRTR